MTFTEVWLLRRSWRLQGEEPEVQPDDLSFRLTPLRCAYTQAFDQDSGNSKQTIKRRKIELPSIEETSDLPEESRIEYVPPDFPFAIYQTTVSLPYAKKPRLSPPPFPYFDLNSPTFGIAALPLSMEGPSSTAASSVSFTAETTSPAHTSDMVTSSRTQDSDVSTNVNLAILSIRAMVSTMLGTPLGPTRILSPFTLGASHQPSVGPLFASSMVNPSIPHISGAQSSIGSGPLFSLTTLLLQAIPFPGNVSMWSSPHVGNTLSQQTSSILNIQSNVLFTLGSVGLFHPGSGGFPPFPTGNYNPNPTPRNSSSLSFGWNWNANNPLGPQNVSLAFSGSSSQQLGTNPSFGLVGNTNPIGQQMIRGQPSTTPQTNVGFNPHFVQLQRGMTGSSHQPLGQVQPLSQFQQMGGSNVPFNPYTLSGQGLQ